MSIGGTLAQVVAVLRELGGYFVWRDASGEEFVILAKRDFEGRLQAQEEQLDLLKDARTASPTTQIRTADDMLEKINRDLALYQLQREDEEMEDEFPLPPKDKPFDTAQGKRVRFEPLRGDLPPDLQE